MAKSKKRKQRRNVSRGVAHIKATFNNTIVTITDTNGDTLCYSSAGTVGFNDERGRYQDNHLGKGRRHEFDPLWVRVEVVRLIVD